MLVEHFEDVGFVVLAAQRNQHATLREVQQTLLEIDKSLTRIFVAVELDSFQSVLPDNAAPERVVAIEDQTLFRSPLECAHDTGEVLRINVQECFPERRLPKIPAAMIERLLRAD